VGPPADVWAESPLFRELLGHWQGAGGGGHSSATTRTTP
jgi:hypothetical protein